MKVVLHHGASSGFLRRLGAFSRDGFEMAVVDPADRGAFATAMLDAEVLLHVLEPVTGRMIADAPRLRLIQKIGVGVNTIDLEAARTRGIAVTNMPGTNSQAVAEFTLALMLATLRRIALLDRATRGGTGWSLDPDLFDTVGEIHGATVGLVGYGEVPRRLAPVLRALGARVLYHSRAPKQEAQAEWCALDELFASGDIVSLHLPVTAQTRGLVDASMLARMKRGAVLINTARGALVDEAALEAALRSGRLAAAGLDVFAVEPVGVGHRLLALDNVVATPHVAWLTPQTLERSLALAVENCERLRRGDPLRNRVV